MSRYRWLLLLAIFLIYGCDSSSSQLPPATSVTGGITGGGTASATSVSISISPSASLSALGTATVTATVLDSNGANISDGTTVTFAIDNATLGSITPTATTASGVATATFTAGSTAGTVTVTVTSGGASGTTTIAILGADVGSIQFVSASTNVIGVRGSGQAEASTITFSVVDTNGQPSSNGTSVTFSLDGPNGGEVLSPTTGSTVDGLVKTILQSGTVAGPVRVTASTVVNGTTISSSSTGVSIGGGIPNMTHLTLATTKLNLAGLAYVNLQSTISSFLADRFGNFNVLEGTSISFYTEAGAIDRSSTTDAIGATSVTFRTQQPSPVSPVSTASPTLPSAWTGTGNPLDGLSTIIAVTSGEECFVDNNGNGIYDGTTIDSFPPSCDISEPFVDADDDGVFDAGTESYIDANQNGAFDTANGSWDGNILIWRKIQIAFTGGPSQILFSPTSFTIANADLEFFDLCVADANANSLMGGSTIGVTASKGTLSGGGPFTIPDILTGPYCFGFTLADASAESPNVVNLEPSTITITVTWKVTGFSDLITTQTISGTID
ncbi:MAG: Ig-like domain-containing protein [Nitrospirota bacterium]